MTRAAAPTAALAAAQAAAPAPTTAATPAPADDVAGQLRTSITRLHRILRQQADVGLTPTRLAHLATIDREGPLTLGDLAGIERVAPPTVTKVVKHLEALGLVARTVDPADKRVVRVHTTATGRQRIVETRSRKDLWLAQRLAALPDADLARLTAALDVLEHLTVPAEP